MSNSAALIAPLSISGSLLNTGAPNVNGIAWAYLPGTTTPATVYADAAATIAVTQPIALDAGGRIPYAQYPNGIYTSQPIRLLIQDATGQVIVSDTTFETGAGSTGLANAGFTGTTVDAAFTALFQSLGGVDGQYREGVGTTPRSIQSVIRSMQITPEDFGAAGNGIADDTAACQAAINAAVTIGRGTVYFAASYKISSVLIVPLTATGITLLGAGWSASQITQATASTSVLSIAAATGINIVGIKLTAGSGGAAISMTGSSEVTVDNCALISSGSGAIGAQLTSTNVVLITRCLISALSGGSNNSVTVKFAGTASQTYISACYGVGSDKGFQWASGYTGTQTTIVDCPNLGIQGFDTTAIANDPGIFQRNCGIDFTIQDNLIADAGHTATPNPLYGTTELRVTSVSGGASITLGTPTPSPAAGFFRGKTFRTYFVNASGSGVTWVFPAGAGQYLTATTVPTANGTKFTMTWLWDGANWNFIGAGQAA